MRLQQGFAAGEIGGQTSICGAKILKGRCRRWVDAVEKGKNELIEILTCVPVETGIS